MADRRDDVHLSHRRVERGVVLPTRGPGGAAAGRAYHPAYMAPGNRADMVAKLPRTGPDAAVIDLEDAALGTGKAGLCKFRTPTAEFRRFKLGAEIPAANLDETERASVRKLSSKLDPPKSCS